MKPLLHIGYPKTATTWFQDKFYPKASKIRYLSREEVKLEIIQPNVFDFSPNILHESINLTDRLVICEEMLLGSLYTGWSNGAFTKSMAIRLKESFPSANVVIFIRNQIDSIASAYNQYVKSGGNYGINTFLFHKKRFFFSHDIFLFSFAFLEYDKIIKYYQELFGKENVHVFLYEEFCKNNKEFVKKYCKELQIEIDLERLDFEKVNLSYRSFIIKLARIFNAFSKKSIYFKYYIVNIPFWFKLSRIGLLFLNKFRIFGNVPSSKKILRGKNYNYIKNYYRRSNQNLYDMGIEQIKEYNYPM